MSQSAGKMCIMEKIPCLICNKMFGRLPYHLITKHHIKVIDYKEKFPNCVIVSKSSIERGMKTRKENYLRDYGVDSIMDVPEIKARIEKAATEGLHKKYNGRRGFQVKEIAEKVKNTNIKKFGVDNAMKDKTVAKVCYDSIKKTLNERCDVDNVMEIPEVVEKWHNTCRDRYGVKVPMQKKEFLTKREVTWKNKYHVKHPMQLKETIQKRRVTSMKKYGETHPMKNIEVSRKNRQFGHRIYLKGRYFENNRDIQDPLLPYSG